MPPNLTDQTDPSQKFAAMLLSSLLLDPLSVCAPFRTRFAALRMAAERGQPPWAAATAQVGRVVPAKGPWTPRVKPRGWPPLPQTPDSPAGMLIVSKICAVASYSSPGAIRSHSWSMRVSCCVPPPPPATERSITHGLVPRAQTAEVR